MEWEKCTYNWCIMQDPYPLKENILPFNYANPVKYVTEKFINIVH